MELYLIVKEIIFAIIFIYMISKLSPQKETREKTIKSPITISKLFKHTGEKKDYLEEAIAPDYEEYR